MDWLRTHDFLAVWLALPLMTILAMFQRAKGDSKPVGMARMTIYFGFIIALGATITPTIEAEARIFTGLLAAGLGIAIGFHAWQEVEAAHPKPKSENKGDGTSAQ